jgi:hypothetical protein
LLSILFRFGGAFHPGFWRTWSPVNTSISCVIGSTPEQYSNLTFSDTLLVHHITLSDGTDVEIPLIDADWAYDHGCLSPCQTKPDPAIFRTPGDYQLLTVNQLSHIELIQNVTTGTERLASKYRSFVLTWSTFTIPFIIVQGFWVAAFGRRSPTQIRDALYILLRDLKIPRDYQPRVRKGINPRRKLAAKWLALLMYAWSLFVTIFCIPILTLTILAAEAYIDGIPASEALTHVGSWSPWAGTVLVLLAAMISKFHRRIVESLFGKHRKSSWRDVVHSIWASANRGFKHIKLPVLTALTTTPASEWECFRHFWEDADNAEYYNRHGKILPARLDEPRVLDNRSQTLPAELSRIKPRKTWWNTKLPAEDSSNELADNFAPSTSLLTEDSHPT